MYDKCTLIPFMKNHNVSNDMELDEQDLKTHTYLYLNIKQLDALNFIMSLFHASTCFKRMCSKHVEA